jgi:FkbM family methyltransferase
MANLVHLAKPFHSLIFKSKLFRSFSAALLKSFVPSELRIGGSIVCLNPKDPVISAALALGVYEREETAFFRKNLRDGMALVDVGANVGLFTALAIRQKASRILAVEPHRESLVFLEKTILANKPPMPVTIEPVAVGAAQGQCDLFMNPFNKGDNRTTPAPELLASERVRVETLDDLCAKHGISQIDFLKIDVQGGELGVLLGASGILGDSPNCILLSEVWPGGMARSGYSLQDFNDCLRDLGFKIERVFGRRNKILPKPSKNFSDYTNFVASKGSVKVGRDA